MTLTPGETPGHGIAVFPFLKITQTIQLGNFTFRSTDDIEGLGDEDAQRVREVSQMLFLLGGHPKPANGGHLKTGQ
jgi:hypothetical protein